MEVILDTNFIVSCIKKRIDFLEDLRNMGFKVVVPREVLEEMKDLRLKVGHEDRAAIDVAFQMLEGKKALKMKLGKKTVDEGLIHKGKEGYYIATLDAAIKRAIPNRVVIENSKSSLIVERD